MAIGRLAEMFIGSSPSSGEDEVSSWTLAVPPDRWAAASRWKSSRASALNKTFNVYAYPALNSDRRHESLPTPGIWCDLTAATTAASIAVREEFIQEIYPLLTITHTLSVPSLLEGLFLQLLTGTTFKCDVAICSTTASAECFKRLLMMTQNQLLSLGCSEASFAGSVQVVPLPLDTTRYIPGQKQKALSALDLPSKAFIILYLGYISLTKADLFPFPEPFFRLR